MIVTLMEHGHLWAFAGITKDLIALGYQVFFSCDSRNERTVKDYGFEPAVFKIWNSAPRWAIDTWRGQVVLGALNEPRPFAAHVKENDIDCLLVDEHLSPAGFVGFIHQIPTAIVPIYISNNYSSHRNIPPPRFYRYPFANSDDRKSFEASEWSSYLSYFRGVAGRFFEKTGELIDKIGYPPNLVSDQTGTFPWLSGYPYLILCPKAFQYSGAGDSHEIYCGPCLTDEVATHSESSGVKIPSASAKPLFVVSLGSQTQAYANAETTLKLLVNAFARHPEWEVVVSFGAHFDCLSQYMKETHPSATHIKYDSWIDQKTLIRRASVLVTHGGLSSVKEALFHCVPMLVTPQAHDQFGNAARVAYHKIGIAMPSDPTNWVSKVPEDAQGLKLAQACVTPLLRQAPKVTVGRLEEALTALVIDPTFKHNVTEMGMKTRREQDQKIAAKFIHKMIQNNRWRPCENHSV